MAVKTTGAEFKAFYKDEPYWNGDWFTDDTVVFIDGVEDNGNIDYLELDDSCNIEIANGVVFKGGYDNGTIDYCKFFKDWRKLQTVEFLTVEIPKGTADKLKEFIKTLKA